mmetsp:Transcript_15442/g.55545  ORF Transcript_15442/g.55545 Transcript_15442/m.55545 type:complete len:310 (-) Transcript_15442:1147-2076(-)
MSRPSAPRSRPSAPRSRVELSTRAPGKKYVRRPSSSRAGAIRNATRNGESIAVRANNQNRPRRPSQRVAVVHLRQPVLQEHRQDVVPNLVRVEAPVRRRHVERASDAAALRALARRASARHPSAATRMLPSELVLPHHHAGSHVHADHAPSAVRHHPRGHHQRPPRTWNEPGPRTWNHPAVLHHHRRPARAPAVGASHHDVPPRRRLARRAVFAVGAAGHPAGHPAAVHDGHPRHGPAGSHVHHPGAVHVRAAHVAGSHDEPAAGAAGAVHSRRARRRRAHDAADAVDGQARHEPGGAGRHRAVVVHAL